MIMRNFSNWLLQRESSETDLNSVNWEKLGTEPNDVWNLLYNSPVKDYVAKLIIQNKPELDGNMVFNVLFFANDKLAIAKLLGPDNIQKMSQDEIRNLISYSQDKLQLSTILGPSLVGMLSGRDIKNILEDIKHPKEIDDLENILGPTNLKKLSPQDVSYLLRISNFSKQLKAMLDRNDVQSEPKGFFGKIFGKI